MDTDAGRPGLRKTFGGVLAIAGGGLLVLGALLSWIEVFIPATGLFPSLDEELADRLDTARPAVVARSWHAEGSNVEPISDATP